MYVIVYINTTITSLLTSVFGKNVSIQSFRTMVCSINTGHMLGKDYGDSEMPNCQNSSLGLADAFQRKQSATHLLDGRSCWKDV